MYNFYYFTLVTCIIIIFIFITSIEYGRTHIFFSRTHIERLFFFRIILCLIYFHKFTHKYEFRCEL